MLPWTQNTAGSALGPRAAPRGGRSRLRRVGNGSHARTAAVAATFGVVRGARQRVRAEKSSAVWLGHDGSAEAAEFLELLAQRQLLGAAQLLSALGTPSEVDGDDFGRVWALLPGRSPRVLKRLDEQSWALEPPSVGQSYEWETWAYLQTLLGKRWWDAYCWEYWRFLAPLPREDALEQLRRLQEAATTEAWWKLPENRPEIASMLRDHGFCALDAFLPSGLAASVASAAKAAYARKEMGLGVLSTGASFARGDAVLWVNTQDPSTAGKSAKLAPKEGQSSAAVPELAMVLEHIDGLVAQLAPEFERMQCIRTRSHAMFTCYPEAAAAELLDATGKVWTGPFADGTAQGYLRHLDNVRQQGHCGRILTTILYLNDDWREADGGAIRLFEASPPLQVRAELLPEGNRLLCFWADEVPHEVLPPKRDRFACTFWYLDRDADPSSVAFAEAPAVQVARAAGTDFLD
ncbi:unnamed protein product [Effrenium voratum]|uniref:Fe2OG dioxygenase domain-containing protein n=1 Tax=Effrenium voratum TaxID=2562239 RepID=A0AA36IW46_9DINO|nr:unnamed protein product [Effrenium voratum]CAJ1428291.1 unnamed protein product [Effrenium voratum]